MHYEENLGSASDKVDRVTIDPVHGFNHTFDMKIEYQAVTFTEVQAVLSLLFGGRS